MNAVAIAIASTPRLEDKKHTCPMKPVPKTRDVEIIDNIAIELYQHASNLRYTFQDENTYKSLTDFFVINMVMRAVPLVGANMDLVKLHCIAISSK